MARGVFFLACEFTSIYNLKGIPKKKVISVKQGHKLLIPYTLKNKNLSLDLCATLSPPRAKVIVLSLIASVTTLTHGARGPQISWTLIKGTTRWSFGHVRAISRAHRAGCRVNVSFTFPFHRARISQNLPRARGTPLLWQWWAKYAKIIFFCQPLECWKWTQWTLQDPMQYYTHCNITWKWIVFGKRFWTIFQTFRNHLCVTSSHILFETNMSENFIK